MEDKTLSQKMRHIVKEKDSFSDRLEKMIYSLTVKEKNFYFRVSFTTHEEADRYQKMYPNKKMILTLSYLYEKAEDAISNQKLRLIE